jgi:hypothetical protein
MRRDINFFSVYHSQSDGDGANKIQMILLSALAGSLIIVLVIFTVIKFSDLAVINTINAQNQYLSSPTVSQARQTLSGTRSKLGALAQYKQAAGRVSYGYSLLPQPDSSLLTAIAKMEPSDVTLTSIVYSDDVMTLTCTCKDNQSPAIFAHTLDASGKFAGVNYNGITTGGAAGSASTANSDYTFTVMITLKGGTAK